MLSEGDVNGWVAGARVPRVGCRNGSVCVCVGGGGGGQGVFAFITKGGGGGGCY